MPFAFSALPPASAAAMRLAAAGRAAISSSLNWSSGFSLITWYLRALGHFRRRTRFPLSDCGCAMPAPHASAVQPVGVEGFGKGVNAYDGTVFQFLAVGVVPGGHVLFQEPLQAGRVRRVWVFVVFVGVFQLFLTPAPGVVAHRLQCLVVGIGHPGPQQLQGLFRHDLVFIQVLGVPPGVVRAEQPLLPGPQGSSRQVGILILQTPQPPARYRR